VVTVADVTEPAVPPIRHWSDYPVESLLAAKGDQRLSVVIPARDEQDSVGDVVAALRHAWVEQTPLIDELVVIDSDSVDDTVEVARAAGAIVHSAKGIRPDLGPAEGKGEALWKSLHVVTGDVLAFIDADLVEWGSHFVPGLAGPLLTDPTVHLVKAVYDRPLLDAAGQEAESGGRVTELVARPLIALHRPALRAIVQPLAGEWAIRRDIFASLSVPTGYGVEIAALIDIADRFGAGAIAQVDLGRRAHRNRRHDTLGPMAVQVLAAAEARCGVRPVPSVPTHVELTQFVRGASGFEPHVRRPAIGERPPACDVPGYRRGGE